jgi:transcription elongation factor SPT5
MSDGGDLALHDGSSDPFDQDIVENELLGPAEEENEEASGNNERQRKFDNEEEEEEADDDEDEEDEEEDLDSGRPKKKSKVRSKLRGHANNCLSGSCSIVISGLR